LKRRLPTYAEVSPNTRNQISKPATTHYTYCLWFLILEIFLHTEQ